MSSASGHNAVKLAERMMAALPTEAANPFADDVRKVLVSAVKMATPGEQRGFREALVRDGPSFRQIFFRDYEPDAMWPIVAHYLRPASEMQAAESEPAFVGQRLIPASAEEVLEAAAIAILCEGMYEYGSGIRRHILRERVRQDLDALYEQMKSRLSYELYVLAAGMWLRLGAGILPFLPAEDDRRLLRQVSQVYRSVMLSDAWLNEKTAQSVDGYWTNQEWELYHHYIYLLALGASEQEIDELIGAMQEKLQKRKVRIADDVAQGQWKSWKKWWFKNRIGAEDVKDAREAMLTRDRMTPDGGIIHGRTEIFMPEHNSYGFTAEGQPGNRYRTRPSGSLYLSKIRKGLN